MSSAQPKSYRAISMPPCGPLTPLKVLSCLAQMMLVTEFMPGNDLGTCIRKDVSVPRVTGWYCRGQSILLGIARFSHTLPVYTYWRMPCNSAPYLLTAHRVHISPRKDVTADKHVLLASASNSSDAVLQGSGLPALPADCLV